MKHHYRILFITIVLACGLVNNCKADTIDNYQIYIGKKLQLTESSFSPLRSTSVFLLLDSSNQSATLHINFSHCAGGVSGRQLKLTDSADRTIITWKFVDKDEQPPMDIPINEILANEAVHSYGSFNFYYMDKQYANWHFLAPVQIGYFDTKKTGKKNLQTNSNNFLLYIVAALVVAFLLYRFIRSRNKGN